MQPTFIIANWKAHKTASEVSTWFAEIVKDEQLFSLPQEKIVVICPPFHLLPVVYSQIQQHTLPFQVGAQDVSMLPMGAYTGEVTAMQLKEVATYAIIGHSERRKYLHESDEMLARKVAQAGEAGLSVVYCVRGIDDPIPTDVTTVAYEPVSAIGSGHADTPEDASSVAQQIQEQNPQVQTVIYGGSVTGDNVSSFLTTGNLSGVLVGTDSLDPHKFAAIIHNS